MVQKEAVVVAHVQGVASDRFRQIVRTAGLEGAGVPPGNKAVEVFGELIGGKTLARHDAAALSVEDRDMGPCLPIQSDRKSTRLNSSHKPISYAVFCLKKKKIDTRHFPALIHHSPSRTAT